MLARLTQQSQNKKPVSLHKLDEVGHKAAPPRTSQGQRCQKYHVGRGPLFMKQNIQNQFMESRSQAWQGQLSNGQRTTKNRYEQHQSTGYFGSQTKTKATEQESGVGGRNLQISSMPFSLGETQRFCFTPVSNTRKQNLPIISQRQGTTGASMKPKVLSQLLELPSYPQSTRANSKDKFFQTADSNGEFSEQNQLRKSLFSDKDKRQSGHWKTRIQPKQMQRFLQENNLVFKGSQQIDKKALLNKAVQECYKQQKIQNEIKNNNIPLRDQMVLESLENEKFKEECGANLSGTPTIQENPFSEPTSQQFASDSQSNDSEDQLNKPPEAKNFEKNADVVDSDDEFLEKRAQRIKRVADSNYHLTSLTIKQYKEQKEQSATFKQKLEEDTNCNFRAADLMPDLQNVSLKFADYMFTYWAESKNSSQFFRNKASNVTISSSVDTLKPSSTSGADQQATPTRNKAPKLVLIQDFYPQMVVNGLAPSQDRIQQITEALYSQRQHKDDPLPPLVHIDADLFKQIYQNNLTKIVQRQIVYLKRQMILKHKAKKSQTRAPGANKVKSLAQPKIARYQTRQIKHSDGQDLLDVKTPNLGFISKGAMKHNSNIASGETLLVSAKQMTAPISGGSFMKDDDANGLFGGLIGGGLTGGLAGSLAEKTERDTVGDQSQKTQKEKPEEANGFFGDFLQNLTTSGGDFKHAANLMHKFVSNRYSQKSYLDLLRHIWNTQLIDASAGKNGGKSDECSESRLYKFMKDNKIINDKTQLDMLFKECQYPHKNIYNNVVPEEVTTVTYTIFEELFLKPLMFIGMENVLHLIDMPKPSDEDSKICQTLAVVNYRRKLMLQVFNDDKKISVKAGGTNPHITCQGFDKYETIKFMSDHCNKLLEQSGMTQQQLRSNLNNKLRLSLIEWRKERAKRRAIAQFEGRQGEEIVYTSDDSS